MMLSNNSCSGDINWRKCWLWTIILTFFILLFLEVFWRAQGHEPTFVDDKASWSIERSKIGRFKEEIVLLGSSRILTDISTTTLKKLAPDYKIINLAIDGTCANDVLHDLANDKEFSGIVMVDMTARCLLFGDDKQHGVSSYIKYYHNNFNLNVAVNRKIATLMQNNFTVIDPYLNLFKVAGNYLLKGEFRTPKYWKNNDDRSQSVDFTKLDVTEKYSSTMLSARLEYADILSNITEETFIFKTTQIKSFVNEIYNRGGKVVFVRFPVSKEHWELDEKFFPKERFWDRFSSSVKAETIHFVDWIGVDTFECPDSSHLDYRDAPYFTELLFDELSKKNVF